MNAVFAWKTAHVISAAVLLGTGIGIAFFAWFGYQRARRHADIGALRAVLRLTVVADAVFTAPAVLFQVVSGIVLMRLYEWPIFGPWALWVWGLFVLVGACWLPVVVMQIKLSRWAEAAPTVADLPERFHRVFRWWFVLGVPAFLMVLAIYLLMVLKPIGWGVLIESAGLP